MSEILQKIVWILYVIHQENTILIKALCGKEKGEEIAEQCENTIKKILDGEKL